MLHDTYRIQWADDLRNAGIGLTPLQTYQEYIEWAQKAPLADVTDHVSCVLRPITPTATYHSKSDIKFVQVYIERLTMARGKKKEAKSNFGVEFVSIRLDDDDKALLAEMEEPLAEEVTLSLQSWIDDGYKISVNMSDNGSVNMTLTCKDVGHPNEGLALSGWGDAVITAFMSIRYKHEVKAEGNWRTATTTKSTTKFG